VTGPTVCAVYLARLSQLRPRHDSLLSGPETQRAARYRLQADRDRFVLATALLRIVAACQAGGDPAELEVNRSCERCGAQHGRPRLPGTGLAASISHSGDVVAVALTAGLPVGVDVEAISARDYEPLVPRVCTAAERQFVRTAEDFYAYWTKKEAVLKATGTGLRTPMTAVTVTPPGTAPVVEGVEPCRLATISAGAGYAAAVAVLTASPVTFDVSDADVGRAGWPA
jgi:4'-phosphopantetheinyl transferase